MTREEAREILTHNWTRVDNPNYSESELDEAFFMAIEALSSAEVQAKCIAEIKVDAEDIYTRITGLVADKVDVVRCMDCRFYWGNLGEDDTDEMYGECRWDSDEMPNADDYCSYGERADKCE